MTNSYLCNSRDFHIDSFTVINSASSRIDKAFELLHDNIAIDAVHNSQERSDAPKCEPETRKALREEILSWITNEDHDDEPRKILWLTGPAGTGKTAIAARRSKRCLVATLAYDLILPLDDDHPLRRAVISAILRDPSVFCRRLKDQLRLVLVKPLLNTRHQFDASKLPKVFVLDGLDEVQAAKGSGKLDKHKKRLANENDQEEILLALLSASSDPTFPFRIIVASRPERVIRNFFSTYASHATREIFLDERYDPDSDIGLFLVAKFAEIRRRYRLPPSWPSEKDIQKLVDTASGQFVYAATVIRFLEGGSHPSPRDLLEAILNCRSQQAVEALAPLDALYTSIIMSSPDPLLAFRWLRIIGIDDNTPASFVDQLLQDFEGHAEYLLENLTSLIRIPPAEDRSSPYRVYHQSFFSFLRDEGRCDQEMAETLESSHIFYFERCTNVMIRKSPAVPLPEPQGTDFIRRFLELDDRSNICYIVNQAAHVDQQGLRALVGCDVVWWVHRAILSQGTQTGERRVSKWFDQVHKNCSFLSPGQCIPQCKHWRSNILRACKGLGWDTPNAIALFREALRRSIQSESKQLESRSGTNPAAEPTTTLYVVDKDYQDMLKIVEDMFSHLPAGWESKYLKELGAFGANVRNVFTAEIEVIKCKLGIETLDSGALMENSDLEDGAYQDWDVSKIWRSLGGVSGGEVWSGRGGSCRYGPGPSVEGDGI